MNKPVQQRERSVDGDHHAVGQPKLRDDGHREHHHHGPDVNIDFTTIFVVHTLNKPGEQVQVAAVQRTTEAHPLARRSPRPTTAT